MSTTGTPIEVPVRPYTGPGAFADDVARLTDAVHAALLHEPNRRLYVYARPGWLMALDDDAARPTAGWELAASVHVPRHLDRAGLQAWLLDRLRVAPCLPPEVMP